MNIHSQPFDGSFGEKIINWLNTSSGEFFCISAFAKNSGVLLLEEAVQKFRSRGGIVNFIVGIDLDGTSVEALKNLLRFSDNLYIVHSENNITFHPKIYVIKDSNIFRLAVGSNNLTRGGLYNNYESALVYENSSGSSELIIQANKLINKFTDLSNKLVLKITDENDINNLHNEGYISLEKEIQLKTIKSRSIISNKKNKNKLFGNEHVLYSPGKISNSNNKTSDITTYTSAQANLSTPNINDIFWFEAGNLTGGSRNILDLSKKGTLKSGSAVDTIYYLDSNTVQGGVRFFGLNPETPTKKDITINFNGSNYSPATIKYAEANSNWRLQIKGTDINGIPITTSIGSEMIGQLLLFEKLDS